MARKQTLILALTAVLGAIVLTACGNFGQPFGFIDKDGKLVVDLAPYDYSPFKKSDLTVQSIEDYSGGMAPIQLCGYQQGFLNLRGDLVLFKKFHFAEPFSEGLAAFSDSRYRWGFTNPEGAIIIPPQYARVGRFSEGVANVCTDFSPRGSKWIFVDKNGKSLGTPVFESAGSFSQGRASVWVNHKVGSIDKTGKVVIPPSYDNVYPASCGVIVCERWIETEPSTNARIPVRKEYVYLDIDGRFLFKRSATPARLKCRPTIWEIQKYRQSIIPDYPDPSFKDNLAVIKEGSKYGYIGLKGHLAIPAKYDFAWPFSEGMALVYEDSDGGKLAFINQAGDEVTPFRFRDAASFSDGLALVSEDDQGPCGFIDKTGSYKLQAIYKHAHSFHEGRTLVGDVPTW